MSRWQFRRSKSLGPLRFTLGRRGVSTSIGWGPFRFGRSADGTRRRTIRIPNTGIYRTDRIDDEIE